MNILLREVELSAFVGRSLAVGSKIEVLWRYEVPQLLVCEALDAVIVLGIVVRRAPPSRVIFMLLAETFRTTYSSQPCHVYLC